MKLDGFHIAFDDGNFYLKDASNNSSLKYANDQIVYNALKAFGAYLFNESDRKIYTKALQNQDYDFLYNFTRKNIKPITVNEVMNDSSLRKKLSNIFKNYENIPSEIRNDKNRFEMFCDIFELDYQKTATPNSNNSQQDIDYSKIKNPYADSQFRGVTNSKLEPRNPIVQKEQPPIDFSRPTPKLEYITIAPNDATSLCVLDDLQSALNEDSSNESVLEAIKIFGHITVSPDKRKEYDEMEKKYGNGHQKLVEFVKKNTTLPQYQDILKDNEISKKLLYALSNKDNRPAINTQNPTNNQIKFLDFYDKLKEKNNTIALPRRESRRSAPYVSPLDQQRIDREIYYREQAGREQFIRDGVPVQPRVEPRRVVPAMESSYYARNSGVMPLDFERIERDIRHREAQRREQDRIDSMIPVQPRVEPRRVAPAMEYQIIHHSPARRAGAPVVSPLDFERIERDIRHREAQRRGQESNNRPGAEQRRSVPTNPQIINHQPEVRFSYSNPNQVIAQRRVGVFNSLPLDLQRIDRQNAVREQDNRERQNNNTFCQNLFQQVAHFIGSIW
jgi:hypothetical protein